MRKSEMRQEIIRNTNLNKRSVILKYLLQVSELLRKYSNDEEYMTMSEAEKNTVDLITVALRIKNPVWIRRASIIVRQFEKEG